MTRSIDLFVNAFSDVVSDSTSTFLEESFRTGLEKMGSSSILIAVSGEFVKSSVHHLVGPLLHAFLKILDPTQKKLDAILAEPLQTGISLARQALSMQVLNEADQQLQTRRFHAALEELEKAFSYAPSRNNHVDERLKIRFTQAAIAKALGTSGAVTMYLSEYRSGLEEKEAAWKRYIKDCEMLLERARAGKKWGGRFGGAPRYREASAQTEMIRTLEDMLLNAKQQLENVKVFARFWGFESGDEPQAPSVPSDPPGESPA